MLQLFAVQLASYLCLQFPLPKAMGVARYILSRLSSLLATLPFSKRAPFFTPTLPTLVRFCRAFPPLCDEATGFLLELGRVAASHASASVGFTLGKNVTLYYFVYIITLIFVQERITNKDFLIDLFSSLQVSACT